MRVIEKIFTQSISGNKTIFCPNIEKKVEEKEEKTT